MMESPLHEFLLTQRDPHQHVYLLVDPLAGCNAQSPLALPKLADALGDDAITRVPRADLAHEPDACPRLITLAGPQQTADASLIDASLAHAAYDATRTKRYVCGWLTSMATPAIVAEGIAQRCVLTRADGRPQLIPFFEPLRLELLAATSRTDLSGWLGDIHAWVLPTSMGSVSLLRHAESAHWPPEDKTLLIQQDVPSVARLLYIWRDALHRPLPYAPHCVAGDTTLPPQAAVLAWRQLRDARAHRLHRAEDQITLALHRLVIHPRIDEHPRIAAGIASAAKSEQALAESFSGYGDHFWWNIIHAVTTED